MFNTLQDIRSNLMPTLAGLFTALVMGIFTVSTYPPDGQWLWLVIVMLLAIMVGFIFDPNQKAPIWVRHAYLLVMAALVNSLPLFGATFTAVYILNFVISAQTAALLGRRAALVWIVILALLSLANLVNLMPFGPAVTQAIALGAGYFAISSFMVISRQATEAQAHSQHLLEELQRSHARLQEYTSQAEAFAVAEERNRMSREMHDTLGHRLTVAAVQLEGAQRLIPKNPEKAEQMVGVVREQVVEGLTELRRTVAALRTPIEDELSLDRSINRLVHNFETATGTAVHVDLPATLPTLPEEVRHTLYRGVQEGLTNIQRHAQAQQAWIHLAQSNGSLILHVGDDGVGLPDGKGRTGFGLRGLDERTAELGGQFQIHPRTGGGTQVEMILPI